MKLDTFTHSSKEIFVDAGKLTVTINTWSNMEGVNLMVHGAGSSNELALRMAGAFRWEEIDAILVALAAARAA